MMKSTVTALSILVGFSAAASSVQADELPIDNPGFEMPVLADDAWNYSLDNEGWGYFDNGGSQGA